MLEYLLLGGGFAFAAAIQPGPLQLFLFSSVAQRGWKRTLPASFAPMLSDGPIALLVLLVLTRVPVVMSKALQVAGGVLLLYYAWSTYKQWKQQTGSFANDDGKTPNTLFQAAAVNLLNPNPYLGWSLILGPAVLRAWSESPSYAGALIIAFYATMAAVMALTIVLFGTTRFLGPRARRSLILVSAITLAILGVYQLLSGIIGTGVS